MAELRPDSDHTRRLLDDLRRGDRRALGALLARQRPAMRELVALHLDPRLAARADPSDVVQEAQADMARRIDDYLGRDPMPFHLWARKTAYERLLDLHRYHLRRARRAAGREVPLPDRSSLLLARPLLGGGPSPSRQAAARELAERVARAVAGLSEADREVLLMRHAEGLPFGEVACLLGVEPAAARKRFGRALIRLQDALAREGLLGGES
jgi:RNA polymerase sigma-70 factor (ECF subfamily)